MNYAPHPVPVDEQIISRIYWIRNHKVMLDRDLAQLYGVTTSHLKQAVRRNVERFPDDFMFELTKQELADWRSQNVTSNTTDKMGLRHPPFAFTEHGVTMLSSVLKSTQAVQVNIHIVRTFVHLRQTLAGVDDVRHALEALRLDCDKRFRVVFEVLDTLLIKEKTPKHPMGFIAPKEHKGQKP